MPVIIDEEKERFREALEKLARLGNGEFYGNSDGNVIAQFALRVGPRFTRIWGDEANLRIRFAFDHALSPLTKDEELECYAKGRSNLRPEEIANGVLRNRLAAFRAVIENLQPPKGQITK